MIVRENNHPHQIGAREPKTAGWDRLMSGCVLLLVLIFSGCSGDVAGQPGSVLGANLVSPGDCEGTGEVPAGWHTEVGACSGDVGTTSRRGLDRERPHAGASSLLLAGDETTCEWLAVHYGKLPVTDRHRYRLSGWMRTEEVRQEGQQYLNCNLYVRFENSTGQTIVAEGGYPVVGTAPLVGTCDWTFVQTTVTVPRSARMATVACFLSCSGKAWFDDIQFQRVQPGNWRNRRHGVFVYYWEGASEPPATAFDANQKQFVHLVDVLQVTPPDSIPYFRYSSVARKQQLTGVGGNAHVETDGSIHSIHWWDRHEMTHILTSGWGPGTALLAEGLAVYYSGAWQNRPVANWIREFVASDQLLSIPELTATTTFRDLPESITYPESASFVSYLLDQFGIEPFRDLYGRVTPATTGAEFAKEFQVVYDQDLDSCESQWRRTVSTESE